MKTIVTFRATFNAAHIVLGDTTCGERMHGHDWFAEASLVGPVNSVGRIDTPLENYLWASVAELDKKVVNEMVPAVHPTPEGVAGWLFERFRLECPGLVGVTVGFAGHHATVEV